ncbi:MAG: tetratricopeptide repeat protein [Verrucomicrobiota bacterium]
MLRSVAFSPDGKTLASSSSHVAVILWDVATWQEKAVLMPWKARVGSECVRFSPDGKLLATAASWGSVPTKLWDLTSNPPKLTRELSCVTAVDFSPDGERVAGGQDTGSVILSHLATGKELAIYPGGLGITYSIAFSPDGTRLAFGTQGRSAVIWNPRTGEEQSYAHLSPVHDAAFSPDGEVFASSSEDGVVKLWDLAQDPTPARSLLAKESQSLAFSPDGGTLAFTLPEVSIELLDMATGQHRSLPASTRDGMWLTYSPDGKILANWGRDDGWASFYDANSGRALANFRARILAFSPDGKTVATHHRHPPGIVKLLNLDNMQPRIRLSRTPQNIISTFTFAPDGKTLAMAGQFGWLKLWDPATGELQASLQEAQGEYHLHGCLAFSRSGDMLAAGNWDGTLRIWDIRQRRLVTALKGHTAVVSDAQFFPDGRTLITTSEDRTLKFWDVETGQERITFKDQSGGKHSLSISPDGKTLASVAEGGAIILRRAVMEPEAVAVQEELNPDDAESPVAQSSAGDRFWGAGRHQEAEIAYRQALSRLEQLTHRFSQRAEYWERLIYGQFALAVLMRSPEYMEAAEKSFHRAIELHPDQVEPRDAILALARSLQNQGKVSEAEAVQRAKLALCQKIRGNDHPEVARSLLDLSRLLEADKLPEAETLAREALALCKKLRYDGFAVSDALHLLAWNVHLQGRHSDAEAITGEELALRRDTFGNDSLEVDSTLRNHAIFLSDQGKLPEAEISIREARTIQRKQLGNADPASVELLIGLLLKQGKMVEAEAVAIEELSTQQMLFGNMHREVLVALELVAQVVEEQRKANGSENADTLRAMGYLASSYHVNARVDKAIKLREEVLELRKKVNGPDAPETIEAMSNLAISYFTSRRREEATALREKVLELRLKMPGPDHRDTHTAIASLADSYLAAGRRPEALTLREELLALRLKLLGPDHPETILSMDLVADSRLQAGLVDGALSLLMDASTRKPDFTQLAVKLAALQVWFAKDDDHAATCQRMRLWAGNTSNQETAERVAKLTCFRPIGDPPTQESTLTLARRAVDLALRTKHLLSSANLVLGMAEYRGGNYHAAEEALKTSIKLSLARGEVNGTASLYRAMSLFKQGSQVEARALLATTVAKLKSLPAAGRVPLTDGESDQDYLIYWLTLKEAQALLNPVPGK